MWPDRRLAVLRIAVALAFLAVSAAASRADTRPPEAYRLSIGDVLAVTVYGRDDLSGQFPIAPDGTVGLPLLGNVAATGMTPAALSSRLDALLAEHLPGLSVAVSVAQYAPVFIVGDVQRSGRYEYRPDMTVLELVALAGGGRRVADDVENSQLQMIAARQDYADLELQVLGLEALRARLQAELDGVAFTGESLLKTDPDPAWQTIRQKVVAGEQRLFEIRKAAFQEEDQALLAQQKSYEDEIQSNTQSLKLYDREIELLQEDMAAQKELAGRGLTAKSNLREAERNLSSTRRDALEVSAYLARAKQNKLAIEQKRVSLITTRRNQAAEQLQEVDLNLDRMRGRQRSLLATMSEVALMSGESALNAAQVQPSYSILRLGDDRYDEVEAGEQALLKPGDIVRVVLPQAVRPRSIDLN